VVVSLATFKASLAETVPPRDVSSPLAALWWAGKGDWDKAHGIAQDDPSPTASWVHAYLHRIEGDSSNAAYWYRRAGKPVATDKPETEWERIAATLLAGGQGSF
jgi:hypothetical protein